MITRLARSSYLHPWRTVACWLLGLGVVLAVAGALGTGFAGDAHLPGTDSEQAYRLLARTLPATGADTGSIVIHRSGGLRPTDDTAIASLVRDARRISAGTVSGPLRSADGATQVFTVEMPDASRHAADGRALSDVVAVDLERALVPPRAMGLDVELSGDWFRHGDVPASAEQIGLVVAFVVLLLLFGSLVAVGVTLLPALFTVAAAGALVTIVSHLITTADVTQTVATMIGLGVGIDYALFIITRFRTELVTRPSLEALEVAMGTAGRAVALAGGTVAISLLGMLLMGLQFLHGLAIGGAVAVAVAVLSSMTLMPALLRWSTRSMTRSARRRAAKVHHETLWHRWGRLVARRPVLVLVSGLALLGVLAAPVLGMRLAGADAGNDPIGTTTKRSYDLVAAAFGPGVNGPLVVVTDHAPESAVLSLGAALTKTSGVASVGEPVFSSDRTTAAIEVIPTTSPQSSSTEDLVRRLRDHVIADSGVRAHVGGMTATNIDFATVLRHRLPAFIAGVLICSFLLLMLVFRSVLVPLKAVVLNLLSIGAAFGSVVAVFQWGWFARLLGVSGGAPIEPWAPMLLFAIVFGLSMDYEVFLLSAVKEHYDISGDNAGAVVEGLAGTARIITGAAAIMVAVFAGFISADMRAVQLMGFGLAMAVFIDATVVRMLLVPASMELLGARNWWMPRWLDARLPKVALDRTTAAATATDAREPELVGGAR